MPRRPRPSTIPRPAAFLAATAAVVCLISALPAPAAAQDPTESVLTQETAPLGNPTHLDLQRALIAWLACTDAEPPDAVLARVQRRLLDKAPAESESAALAALNAASREMQEVLRAEGCGAARVQRALALFDTYLRPALDLP